MNRHQKINLFGIPIWAITMAQTVDLIKKRIQQNVPTHHVVINAGKVVAIQENDLLKQSVMEADVINADGMAVIWAANLLGHPLPERVTGIDLMEQLIKMAYENNLKCYFLGAREEVVKKVVDFYKTKYSNSVIAGYRNGYFSRDEEANIISKINESGAHLLFVAMSSPGKELLVKRHRAEIKTLFIMGVGGSFDVVSGIKKRAPIWMQKIGLEWFFRFIQEPRRMWKRYLIGNSLFIWLTIKELLKRK